MSRRTTGVYYDRDALQRRATPWWASRAKIRRVYKQCRALTKATGIPHEVDHIVPIGGKDVCGLHVHYNLRPIPKTENRAKRNRFDEVCP